MGKVVKTLIVALGLAAAGTWASTVNLPATLVASTETVKNVVTTGPTTAEGPAWDAASGTLYFSDYDNLVHNQGCIWKVPGGTGAATKWKTALDVPCGMKIDGKGTLYLGMWNIIATVNLSTAAVTPLATASGTTGDFPTGRTVNDLSLAPDGGVFFTYNEWSSESYVYYLPAGGTPQKKLTFASNYFPNGIAYVPEKKILYVNFSQQNSNNIKKYQVDAQGNLTNPANFANVSGPDGMNMDANGDLYVAGGAPASVSVFDSTGKLLGTITLSAGTGGNVTATNLCFGGTDNQTLFVTGGTDLFSLHMNVKGRSATSVAPQAEHLVPVASASRPSAFLSLSNGRDLTQGNSGALFSITGRFVGNCNQQAAQKAAGIYFIKPAK
jgi:sugar lactone lactonase YvrE